MRKLGGSPDWKPDLCGTRSPITDVDDIVVPVLVAQGANDPRVPRSQADQDVDSLTDPDIDHESLLFDDEDHVVRTANRIEYITQTVVVFEAQL